MSHFSGLVILPAGEYGREAAEIVVEQMLAPYDENTEVAPYPKACYCVGSLARRRAIAAAEDQFGNMDQIQAKFSAQPADSAKGWEEFIAPRQAFIEQRIEADPEKGAFDPECDDCTSGVYQTTRNPLSKWDFYTIGGAWSGRLCGVEPDKMLANHKVCWLCHGTGQRADSFHLNLWNRSDVDADVLAAVIKVAKKYAPADSLLNRDLTGLIMTRDFPSFLDDLKASPLADRILEAWPKLPVRGCNGCNGTGIMLDHTSEWKEVESDILKMRDVAADFRPFAFVTPDEDVPVSWHERGKMGWWNNVCEGKEKEYWAQEWAAARERYADHTVVVVDCHI